MYLRDYASPVKKVVTIALQSTIVLNVLHHNISSTVLEAVNVTKWSTISRMVHNVISVRLKTVRSV